MFHESGDYMGGAPEPAAPVRPEVAEYVKKNRGLFEDRDMSIPAATDKYDLMATDKGREDRIAETKRKLAMAQNLDLIGRSLAGYGIGRGPGTFGKINTEGAEQEVSEAQDTLSSADREFLRGTVGDLPEGITYSRLKTLLPTVAGTLNARSRQAETSKRYEASQNVHAEAEKRRQEAFRRLPDKTVNELSSLKTSMDALDRIATGKAEAQSTVGPIEGRINSMLAKYSGTGPEVATLQAELGNVLSGYARSISGAQVSDAEMARLREQLPNLAHKGDTFDSLLKRFRTQLETDYDNKVEFHGKAGREVEQFKRSSAGAGAKSDMVKATDPDTGESRMIPRSQVEQAKKNGLEIKE
jgi:hypothetical protein